MTQIINNRLVTRRCFLSVYNIETLSDKEYNIHNNEYNIDNNEYIIDKTLFNND